MDVHDMKYSLILCGPPAGMKQQLAGLWTIVESMELAPEDGQTICVVDGLYQSQPSYTFPTPRSSVLRVPMFRAEPIMDILLPLLADSDLILFGTGQEGDELASRLAVRMNGSCCCGVCDVSRIPEKVPGIDAEDAGSAAITARRKTYTGHMTAAVRMTRSPFLLSLDRAVVEADVPAFEGHQETEILTFGDSRETDARSEWLDPLEPADLEAAEQSSKDDLEDAEIVLAIGRGIRSAKNAEFAVAQANAIGAELGATRPVVMSAWVPMSRLIGVSGSLLHPGLVLVAGASGSPAFFAGIENARQIIAVNTDPDAPIMRKSDLAIVGDWKEILAELTEIVAGS